MYILHSMLMLEMAEVPQDEAVEEAFERISIDTKVLLDRELGEQKVTIGKVAGNSFARTYGLYEITDENGTTEQMMPDLEFVVPRRGVRVVDTTENDAAAQILDVVTYDNDICLDVKYDDEELEHSPLYDVEDNYLENFSERQIRCVLDFNIFFFTQYFQANLVN